MDFERGREDEGRIVGFQGQGQDPSKDRHKALSDLVSERRIVTHCLILQLALLSRLLS